MAMAVEECRSYVVSRSGKVLDSCGRVLQEIVPSNVSDLSCPSPIPLASFEGQPESFFNLAALLLPPPSPSAATSSKKRKFHRLASPSSSAKPAAADKKKPATCVWEQQGEGGDIGSFSLEDVARAILRRQKRALGRKSSRKNLERLVQHLKVAVSQVRVLQRWQAGSREQPARWASWLLKILRRTKPPPLPLQRFLFTVLVAILPVICCSLVCQMLSILPDPEVLNSSDIICSALDKSWSSFSSFQWEILEERISQCRQARLKAGTWSERRMINFPLLAAAPLGENERTTSKSDGPSVSSSSDEYAVYTDEQLSNELVRSEGVKALARRALRERQVLPPFKKNLSTSTAATVSTLCPLSGKRVEIPARGISCTHLTCFDLEQFLEENAQLAGEGGIKQAEVTGKAMWRCPYCGCDATWPQIIVDGFILRILKTLSCDSQDVLIWPDGRWNPVEASSSPGQQQEVAEKDERNDDDVAGSSASDAEAAPSQRQRGRNVRPRLGDADAFPAADGSPTWDVKKDGFGNHDRGGACIMADQAGPGRGEARNSDAAAADLGFGAAGAGPSTTKLHEINLRDLIQSTLEKTRYGDDAAVTIEQEGNRCAGQLDAFKPIAEL